MKKWVKFLIGLILLSAFSLACASASKDSTIRCPKCGSYFSTKEGAEVFEWMMPGQSETRR